MLDSRKQSDRYKLYSVAAKEHWLMEIEYRAYRGKLAAMLDENVNISQEKAAEIEQLVSLLLERATWQELIYRDYLCVPRMACLFRSQANNYRKALGQSLVDEKSEASYVSNGLAWGWRETWARWLNMLRLTLIRIRRFLNTLAPWLKNEKFIAIMKSCESHFSMIFSYAGWIFFIPRLMIHIGIILKHCFVPQGDESSLTPWLRFCIHLQRRWHELFNDIVWFTGGLMACFVITASMQIPLLFVLQCCDLFSAIFRSCVEINWAHDLLKEYDKSDPVYGQLELQIARLTQNRARDLINFSGLLLGVALMLPVCNFAPWLPLLGTLVMLAITGLRIYWNVNDNERKERLDVNNIIARKLGFFAQRQGTLKLCHKEGLPNDTGNPPLGLGFIK